MSISSRASSQRLVPARRRSSSGIVGRFQRSHARRILSLVAIALLALTVSWRSTRWLHFSPLLSSAERDVPAPSPRDEISNDASTDATPSLQLQSLGLGHHERPLRLQHLDSLEVAYASASPGDWLGVYCVDYPSDGDAADGHRAASSSSVDVAVDDYLDYRALDVVPHGVARFGPLVNMRCRLVFRLVSAANEVRATSDVVVFAQGPAQPTQRHLALTARAGEMRVHWVSANVSRAAVRYGRRRDELTRVAAAQRRTYDASDMCHAPATTRSARLFRDPGVLWDGVMTGLQSGVTYYYQVGSQSEGGGGDSDDRDGVWSEVESFRMPPAAGEHEASVVLSASSSATATDTVPATVPATATASTTRTTQSFFLFGDLMAPTSATADFRVRGSCGTTMRLIERDLDDAALARQNATTTTMVTREYMGVFHVGDLSYAAGKTFVWEHFGALIEPTAKRVPYMVSIGNHDFGYLEGRQHGSDSSSSSSGGGGGGTGASAPATSLRSPRHKVFEADGTHGHDAAGECGVPSEARFQMPENGRGLWWYSVDVGLTHHVVLSSEHDASPGSPMRRWLQQDLASVDRTRTPWLLVHIHRPLYCSVAFGGDFTRSLLLRDALETLFLQHRVDVVVSGHYHSYERTCAVFDEVCYEGADGEAQAPVHLMVGSGGANIDEYGYYRVGWSAFAKTAYGYGRLHVHNATHLEFEFVGNDEEAVIDSTWIVSTHRWPTQRTRWRRWVYYPSLQVVVAAALALVLVGTAVGLRRRRRVDRRGRDREHQRHWERRREPLQYARVSSKHES
ncbi:hypothetical protein PINS_up024200 [Pythium insidiosum]|nr:hypothetical protein PINS_up024200 [Pythium insidiosum]